MKKVLVTGGTGLLGSQLLFDLIQKNFDVSALKRTNSEWNLTKQIFKNNDQLFEKIKWLEGDILDVNSLHDATNGMQHVYHCAATVSFDPRKQLLMYKTNAEGTANVVNACLENNVEKLCHVSSVAALGRIHSGDHIDENASWKKSKLNSNYAISKYAAENEVWRGVAEGLNAVIVNPAIILGQGNWKTDSSVLFQRVKSKFPFYSNGVNGFVDVRDVVNAMMQLMESQITGQHFVLAATSITYKNLFDLIADALKVKRPAVEITPLMGAIGWRFEKLRAMLSGKSPLVTKETVSTALHQYYYSSDKIIRALNFQFTPIEKTVEFVCSKMEK